MPFGLCSSPKELQRRLSDNLDGLKGVKVGADDILIYGKGKIKEEAIQHHNQNLTQLLPWLRRSI